MSADCGPGFACINSFNPHKSCEVESLLTFTLLMRKLRH